MYLPIGEVNMNLTGLYDVIMKLSTDLESTIRDLNETKRELNETKERQLIYEKGWYIITRAKYVWRYIFLMYFI